MRAPDFRAAEERSRTGKRAQAPLAYASGHRVLLHLVLGPQLGILAELHRELALGRPRSSQHLALGAEPLALRHAAERRRQALHVKRAIAAVAVAQQHLILARLKVVQPADLAHNLVSLWISLQRHSGLFQSP